LGRYLLNMNEIVPFGRWPSPLSAEQVAAGKVSLSELMSDGVDLYWLESRPLESGRVVLVRADGPTLTDHSPVDVSIRSRVHEYGGGAVTLVPGQARGAFAYINQSDQRVWFCDGAGSAATPRPLSAEPPPGQSWNHGGLSASADGDWVLSVREMHLPGAPAPVRQLVAFGTGPDNGGTGMILEGHDFYGSPRLHPAGDRMAVVVWAHPDMPWDASRVLVVPLSAVVDGDSGRRRLAQAGTPLEVAGGPDESVGQPQWQRDGSLRFMSDRTGWWLPYVHDGCPNASPPIGLIDERAEFHGPDWVLGQVTTAELSGGLMAARRTADGSDSVVLMRIDGPNPGPLLTVDQPCVTISSLCTHGEGIALIGATPDVPATVWWVPIGPDSDRQRGSDAPTPAAAVRPPSAPTLNPHDVSRGEPFSLVGPSGRDVHGALYLPVLGGHAGPPGESPPLVVWCHGGPTASAQAGLDVTLQFLTTRGFAVATVDYAGSTGYGRLHRCGLWGQWGVADGEDCLHAAHHLAGLGQVDGRRMAIRGGSAGGLTALNALTLGQGFAAAVSWYGVTDLLALAATTHDFEVHYTDRLIGPLPESRALYEARSPVHHAGEFHGSVLLLQGADDAVVPPSQAYLLRDALMAAGRRCELVVFEGEGHGFRRADTLISCLDAELEFYQTEFAL
jgi:dipeptidyl aminopeptidase/acylaminoacyl peptidase